MPECSCVVSCHCSVYPSEDPQKVVRAVSQIFEGVTVTAGPDGAGFRSDGPEVLQKIRDATNSRRSHKLYRRHLESNLHGDSTWLYLNKQAACAGTIALCSDIDESPLGPIKVTIQSPDIEEVIRWLASDPAAP